MKRKLPEIGSRGAKEFCRLWDSATHLGKLGLCEVYNVDYQQGNNFRSKCVTLPPLPGVEIPDDSFEGYLRAMRLMDSLVSVTHYVPSEINIEIDTKLPVAVPFTADWQLGQYGVDYASFERDIDTISKEDGLYVYVGGDSKQNIIQPSKMGSAHNQTPISVQNGLLYRSLEKLGNHVLAIGTGNHNYWSYQATGEDWEKELAHRLKLVYTKHAGIINLRVGDMVYQIARMHESRFNSSFNLTHTCKQHQRMDFPNARVVVAEHRHIAALEQSRYNDRECIYIRPGTYAVFDDFAQTNGFFGAHVSNPTVIFYPNEDRLIGFKDMHEALVYLRAVRKGGC